MSTKLKISIEKIQEKVKKSLKPAFVKICSKEDIPNVMDNLIIQLLYHV